LIGPLAPRLYKSVDLLIFNPPYVPTSESELTDARRDTNFSGAWAGGAKGLEVTAKLLQLVPMLLSDKGRFYLVAIAQNHPEKLIMDMKGRYDLHGESCNDEQAVNDYSS